MESYDLKTPAELKSTEIQAATSDIKNKVSTLEQSINKTKDTIIVEDESDPKYQEYLKIKAAYDFENKDFTNRMNEEFNNDLKSHNYYLEKAKNEKNNEAYNSLVKTLPKRSYYPTYEIAMNKDGNDKTMKNPKIKGNYSRFNESMNATLDHAIKGNNKRLKKIAIRYYKYQREGINAKVLSYGEGFAFIGIQKPELVLIRNETVTKQELLIKNGYNIILDGIWGPKSESAWKDYERKQGLNLTKNKSNEIKENISSSELLSDLLTTEEGGIITSCTEKSTKITVPVTIFNQAKQNAENKDLQIEQRNWKFFKDSFLQINTQTNTYELKN